MAAAGEFVNGSSPEVHPAGGEGKAIFIDSLGKMGK
jgi:hypothetical protein